MHDRRSGKVVEALPEAGKEVARGAHRGEEAIWAPRPVADDRIDEAGNAERVDQVADESGAADHCAGGDGGAGIGEGELEDPDGKECDTGGLVGFGRFLQEEPVITDEPVAVAEHEGEADGVEENAAEAGVNDTLHQHVDRFARTAKASLKHREADLHAEDKERRNQGPRSVDRVDDVGSLHCAVGGIDLGKEQASTGHHEGASFRLPPVSRKTVAP